jgi:hypothetical protein
MKLMKGPKVTSCRDQSPVNSPTNVPLGRKWRDRAQAGDGSEVSGRSARCHGDGALLATSVW